MNRAYFQTYELALAFKEQMRDQQDFRFIISESENIVDAGRCWDRNGTGPRHGFAVVWIRERE